MNRYVASRAATFSA